jgi:hypothetical protein
MASKPRKAFDGVGRPQGFIDDAAKAALKAVKNVGRKTENKIYRKVENAAINRQARKQIPRKMVSAKDDREFYRAMRKTEIRNEGGPFFKPPKPKQLPSIKGKNPRPKPDMGNPKAPTTADVDRILSKANAERVAVEAKKSAQKRMSPYYKTSKNSRNYRG